MDTALILPAPRDAEGLVARLPPHNDAAEMALLAAILHNNRAYERVSEFLQPEHFANRVHGRIFQAIGHFVDRGQIADAITLKYYFEHDQDLAEIGGADYLQRLAGSLVAVINAEDYGRIVHELYLRRQLITIGEDVVNDAFREDFETDAHEQIQVVEQRLFRLASEGDIDGGFQTFKRVLKKTVDAAEAAHRRDGALAGVPSGFVDMDRLLGGLHASDLLILAGRPSMGKTALATNIAFNAACLFKDVEARKRHTIGFFSLEMSAEQLATRIIAERIGISSEQIRSGKLSNDEFDRLVAANMELEKLSLFIDDTPGQTVTSLRARARRLARQHGLDMIVIDYLQLLRGSPGARAENRVQEISEITRGLKGLAKELDLPVIALSQLSRAVENREDKRPQLADLRESGSIEQDADVVMFVFREQYYLERAEPMQRPDESMEKYQDRHERWKERCEAAYNMGEVIVAKQRHGPIGSIRLRFDPATTKFSDYIGDDRLPDAMY